jgi:hypothetical protein
MRGQCRPIPLVLLRLCWLLISPRSGVVARFFFFASWLGFRFVFGVRVRVGLGPDVGSAELPWHCGKTNGSSCLSLLPLPNWNVQRSLVARYACFRILLPTTKDSVRLLPIRPNFLVPAGRFVGSHVALGLLVFPRALEFCSGPRHGKRGRYSRETDGGTCF